ncbi:hypothetical protein [Streptomyces sp. NPDC047097]|uniref:hypothetical protein n=1 Tax=Streptomyces sp. NPDC047097 TaxID=3155260 RepID=UPI0033FBF978
MYTIIRSSTLAELRADNERLTADRDAARAQARRRLNTTPPAAAELERALNRTRLARLQDAVAYERRIRALVRAVTRYRAALTAETRRADRLQAAYDHAVGLDHPALDTGSTRQQRGAEEENRKAAAA